MSSRAESKNNNLSVIISEVFVKNMNSGGIRFFWLFKYALYRVYCML